jgi:2-keto-4-pentenoate hydratase/2-oxohepta-3-ene-1,7-dioic acid hydratase in catechol pathway
MTKLYTLLDSNSRQFIAAEIDGKMVDLSESVRPEGYLSSPMLGVLQNWDDWKRKFEKISSEGNQGRRALEPGQYKITAPIPRPPKIMGIAFNNRASERFRDRYAKLGGPGWFLKSPTCVVGQDDDVELAPEGWSNSTTPEIELGIVIGKKARWVDRKSVYDMIAGYTIMNDVTAQDLLVNSEATMSAERYFSRKLVPDPGDSWEKDQMSGPNRIEMKQWDTFAPMGPCIVTKEELPDPHDQSFLCTINDQVLMQGDKIELIWDVPEMVHMFSLIMTLEPGDLIIGGNIGRLSAKGALKPGDRLELTLGKIGTLRNRCVASKYPPVW